MKTIGNRAIAASAGSGKTFQLAHRYIQLMASGVNPDRIIALTFSRKAAGEIFDSVISYLCRAANSPYQAKETGKLIGKETFETHDFSLLLRKLISSLHTLHIGTLDSFAIKIVRTFPIELGIAPGFEVLDNEGAAARSIREQVLHTIFVHHLRDNVARSNFLSAFKQATFGQQEKGLERSLDIFIGDYKNYYRILPSREMWGQADIIWPGGYPWLTPDVNAKEAAKELENILDSNNSPQRLLNGLKAFLTFASTYNETAQWNDSVANSSVFKSLLESVDDLKRGHAILSYNRKEYPLDAKQCGLLLNLLCHVITIELRKALEKTRGIYKIIDLYEQFYDKAIRERGKLSFSDAQYLLTEANQYSGGALISRTAQQDARLYIDYRLDCKLDHWLLDEFQDTSDLQWKVLHNLADEILQDTSGQRSLFYVGDVKQAIYGWRGGNARLFNKILQQYGRRIEQTLLATSFRSCQPIIDTVNRTFGTLLTDKLPPRTIEEWSENWQEHQCQKGFVSPHGYASLLEPRCLDDTGKPTDEDRYSLVSGLLSDIDPLNRGLSVAILVRTNKSGKKIASFLRHEHPEMKIAHEGKAAIKDNAIVSVLLALVQFAAHPGDTFAWRHLQMSPLGSYFAERQDNRDNLPIRLLREIQTDGFQSFVRLWAARLNSVQQLDSFGQSRVNDFSKAAGEFDKNNERDCNAFLHFIDSYEMQEMAAEDAVRIMTIHQSKGLGFDIVILPDLQGKSMSGANYSDFAVARDPVTNEPIWALKMPRSIIAQRDSVLAKQVQDNNETASLDALCVLYVAMTRARNGLYIITSFPGKSSQAFTPAVFLKLQLTNANTQDKRQTIIEAKEADCLYETGDPDWYTKFPLQQKEFTPSAPGQLRDNLASQISKRRRLLNISPSEIGGAEIRADLLFAATTHEETDLGTAIHQLFQKISWIDTTNIEQLIKEWQAASPVAEEIQQKAVAQFQRALASTEIRQALSRPQGNVTLWREKHFDVVVNDQWITGAFDRVVIIRDSEGTPLRATIIDFKSNEISSEASLTSAAESYRSQLSLYGSALSQILHLDALGITLQLIFTQPGKVHRLR
jgi:ATP-dependent helicase/nuclease subunit A